MYQKKVTIEEKLVEIAAVIISKINYKTINEIQKESAKYGVWSKICEKFYGDLDFKKSYLIQKWFQRNNDSFKDRVIHQLNLIEKRRNPMTEMEVDIDNQINKNQTTSDEKNKLKISFEKSSWHFHSSKNVSGKNRKKFLNAFDKDLNSKLFEAGIPCELKCIFNWFSQAKLKNKSPHWRGKYKCSFQDCGIEYFVICEVFPEAKNDFVELVFEWYGNATHDKIHPRKSYRAEERIQLGLKCQAEGISNVRNALIVNNNEIISNSILRKIKHEIDNKEKIRKTFSQMHCQQNIATMLYCGKTA